ncbi:MAG TPA: SpoIIE family protein phosphatase [Gaiellaceae bacterium]|nr:SpoIIE family protein phosphatase [Gaiellaceae bacterium]
MRYVVALAAASAGVLVMVALDEWDVTDQPVYAPLLAAVALTSWYGGFGPSAVVVVTSWGAALPLFGGASGDWTFTNTQDFVRWWINLAVAVVLATLGGLLRFREERSANEAQSARTAVDEIESLQQLSIALATALSSADVARAVSAHSAAILSAKGVALALVEGRELTVVDPGGLAPEGRPNGSHIDLAQTAILAEAFRTGQIAVAHDRAELDTAFRESASAFPDDVHGAIALPLRAEDEVVGAIGFLFGSDPPVDDDTQALARIVTDFAGQALERARLYEQERESRQALDRILRVAPRFLADDLDQVVTAICREACTTFGADRAVLWRVREDSIELMGMDPALPVKDEHRTLPLADFPRLREALRGLGSSFISDVLETTYGAGLDFLRTLGIRSSLRTPVVIGASSELILAISWKQIVSEPDPATIVVVRRFADQAGLALEQQQRRRAEAEIALRAEAARQLQEVTAALSSSATTLDVSRTCLDYALATIRAEAGFVVLTRTPGTPLVELVASAGYDDAELSAWRAQDLDSDVPFARAIASGEAVWALSRDAMSAFRGLVEERSSAWVSIPLVTSRGARGALHLSFRQPPTISATQRDWLEAMVGQCGQALERSSLYEGERRTRLRTERLQGMTTLLSNAVSTGDVATVVCDEVAGAVEAGAVAVASVVDGEVFSTLATSGDGERLDPLLAQGHHGPCAVAISERRSLLFASGAELRTAFPESPLDIPAEGPVLVIPLVSARRANGVLVAAWERERPFAEEERALVEALAGQAAQALDRASRFEAEQTIAETLQRSVLPTSLPRIEGVELAARYLPGSAELDVGGDWFDALHLPDGKVGLVVGDVVGKGVQAAATMAQLRNATRAYSVERLRPASVLLRLNRLADEVLETSFATLAYLLLDPETRDCKLSSAGHPPPLVAMPDGRVELLEGVRGLPLGTGVRTRYRQQTISLPAGSVVLLYTDGLVERRGKSIDDGLEALVQAVSAAPKDPDRLLEHILEHVVGTEERGDDIALLAARVLPVAPRPLELTLASRLESMDIMRDAIRTWLEGLELTRADREDVVLAAWEACANAIEHAVEPRDQVVNVGAFVENGGIRVSVSDSGRWAPPSERDDRGLGLSLIASLGTSMDVVEGATGTTVTFVKTFDAPVPSPTLEEPDEQQDHDDE